LLLLALVSLFELFYRDHDQQLSTQGEKLCPIVEGCERIVDRVCLYLMTFDQRLQKWRQPDFY
jgi:hypothetical protein